MRNNLKYFFSAIFRKTKNDILNYLFLSPSYLYIMYYLEDFPQLPNLTKTYTLSEFVNKYNDYINFSKEKNSSKSPSELLHENDVNLYNFFKNYMDTYYLLGSQPQPVFIVDETQNNHIKANQTLAHLMNEIIDYFKRKEILTDNEPSYTLAEIGAALANCCYDYNRLPFDRSTDPFPRVWNKELYNTKFEYPLSELLYAQKNIDNDILIKTGLANRKGNIYFTQYETNQHHSKELENSYFQSHFNSLFCVFKNPHVNDITSFKEKMLLVYSNIATVRNDIKDKLGEEVYYFYKHMRYVPDKVEESLLENTSSPTHQWLRTIFCHILLDIITKKVIATTGKLQSISVICTKLQSNIPKLPDISLGTKETSSFSIIKYLPFILYSFITSDISKENILVRFKEFKTEASTRKALYRGYPIFWTLLLFSSRKMETITPVKLDFYIDIFRHCMESCYTVLCYYYQDKITYQSIDFFGSIALFITSFPPSNSIINFKNSFQENPLDAYTINSFVLDFLGYSDDMKLITSSQKFFHYVLDKQIGRAHV